MQAKINPYHYFACLTSHPLQLLTSLEIKILVLKYQSMCVMLSNCFQRYTLENAIASCGLINTSTKKIKNQFYTLHWNLIKIKQWENLCIHSCTIWIKSGCYLRTLTETLQFLLKFYTSINISLEKYICTNIKLIL